jgi:hypothetical protein
MKDQAMTEFAEKVAAIVDEQRAFHQCMNMASKLLHARVPVWDRLGINPTREQMSAFVKEVALTAAHAQCDGGRVFAAEEAIHGIEFDLLEALPEVL